jgi:hypothetical protein
MCAMNLSVLRHNETGRCTQDGVFSGRCIQDTWYRLRCFLVLQRSDVRVATYPQAKAKIMVIRDIERDEIEYISKTLGCVRPCRT